MGSARRRRRAALAGSGGYVLIEMLIAAALLVIGLVGLMALLDATVKTTAATRGREGASNLARQILEDARTVPFGQISPTAITSELQAMTGLADASSAAGWQVVQRGITYTVTVSDCSIDDPKDGYGVHENAFNENPFCADSTKTGTEDAQPEDLKRLSVDVTWSALGRKPDVHQVETLTAAGEAPGLAASGLHLESPVISPNFEPTVSEQPASGTLTFAVSAPSSTSAMRWSLEGVAQSNAPAKSSGTTWTFSWSIPYPAVKDGTYTVSVQAIDPTGVYGPPISIPVTLIRGVPEAPKNLKGGFNTIFVEGEAKKVVELEWSANSERNVIGYRVKDPNKTLTCPENEAILSVALSCIDSVGTLVKPPEPSSPNLMFTAAALYRNYKGEVKEGNSAGLTIEGGPPPKPEAPTFMEAKKNADGSVTIKWTLPPLVGPTVKFFRIYRGSKNYTSRYAATESGTTTTFVDEDAAAVHEYWITAVDSNLTESTFVGGLKA